jgi:phage-related tail fiber protein
VTGTDARLYGDANAQEAFGVVVNRLGTDPEKDAVWMTGGFISAVDFGGGVSLTGSTDPRKFVVKLK